MTAAGLCASSSSPRDSHEISAQISQLNHFIHASRAAVQCVSSLELVIKFHARGFECDSNMQGVMPAQNHTKLSDAAAADLASVLAHSFPNICHLGVGEGVTAAIVRVLSASCPNLDSLEQLPRNPPGTVCSGASQQLVSLQLRAHHCNKLVDHLNWRRIWHSLAPMLRELRCDSLPLCGLDNPQLRRLQAVHLTGSLDDGLDVSRLCDLLRFAPQLRALSHVTTSSSSIVLGRCWPSDMEDMHVLHRHITEHGIRLGTEQGGVPLRCTSFYANAQHGLLPLHHLLSNLPAFPVFTVCTLSVRSDESTADCLSKVAALFPSLATLTLVGPWLDEDLLQLVDCVFLKELVLQRAHHLTAAGLAELLRHMPWVHSTVESLGPEDVRLTQPPLRFTVATTYPLSPHVLDC